MPEIIPNLPKFIDIPAGSKVIIRDTLHQVAPREGTVLGVEKEWGATHIPALRLDCNGEELVVSDSGRWKAEMLLDGALLAETPTGIVKVTLEPYETEAIRFNGGIPSAVEILRWAEGNAKYVPAAGDTPEHVLVGDPSRNVTRTVEPGQWLVKLRGGELEVLSDAQFRVSWTTIR